MLWANSIALSGMNAAQVSLQAAAQNIANLGTNGFRRQQVSPTTEGMGGVIATTARVSDPGNSLGTDVVGQLQAKNAFLANLAVFRTSDQMAGSLLNAVS